MSGVAELTGPSRFGPDLSPVCRIDGTVLVTDPALVDSLLTDRRLHAARPGPRWWAGRQEREAAAFYAAWPMFSDDAVHAAGRTLAKSAVDAALARLSRPEVASIVASALRPGASVHDWAGGEARAIVRLVLARCAGVDGAQLTGLEGFAHVVLDELAVVGSTRSRRRRLLAARDEVAALLLGVAVEGGPGGSPAGGPAAAGSGVSDVAVPAAAGAPASTPPLAESAGGGFAASTEAGLVGPYAAALRAGTLPPDVVLGSFAQVITGLLDPLIAAVAAVPLVLAAGALDEVETTNAQVATTLGLASPFRFTSRFAAEEMVVDGVRVRSGERLVLHLGAASLAKIERGETARLPYFGVGAHYCLGARVATLVVGEVIEALAGRTVEVHACSVLPTLFLRFARLDVSYV